MKKIQIIFILFITWLIASNYYTRYRKDILKVLIKMGLSLNQSKSIIERSNQSVLITALKDQSQLNSRQLKRLRQKLRQNLDNKVYQQKSLSSSSLSSSSISQKSSSLVNSAIQKQLSSIDSQNKCDNLTGNDRDKCLQNKKDTKLATQTAKAALKAANLLKIRKLTTKLMSGPAGLIILVIIIILENVLELDVENFSKCNNDEYDLTSLPGYARTIISMVPNLGDLFDLIGNKLCFKSGCPPDTNKQDGLCYKNCRPEYKAVGPVCWKSCGNNIDAGALCRERCRPGYNEVAGVCWKGCDNGFKDIGALCSKPVKCNTRWDKCATRSRFGCIGGLKTNCTGPETKAKSSYIPKTYAKESYGRGIGTIPLSIRMKPRKT